MKNPQKQTNLGRIAGVELGDLNIPEDIKEEAAEELNDIIEDGANEDLLAENLWSLRLDITKDIKYIKSKRKKTKLREEDLIDEYEYLLKEIAYYNALLIKVGNKVKKELKIHEKEKDKLNGVYIRYRCLIKKLREEEKKLIS